LCGHAVIPYIIALAIWRGLKTQQMKKCKGCGIGLNAFPALSRYSHGDICSDCGVAEAFNGDFISKYPCTKDEKETNIWPVDKLLQDNITA
jgi:hypothetical protein